VAATAVHEADAAFGESATHLVGGAAELRVDAGARGAEDGDTSEGLVHDDEV
jgi:hypothetical protein